MHMHTYSRTSTHAHVLTHTGHHTVLPSAEAGWGDARTSLCKHARARAHAHTHTHMFTHLGSGGTRRWLASSGLYPRTAPRQHTLTRSTGAAWSVWGVHLCV